MNVTKKLILLRHGQAENTSAGGADFNRTLTQKGKRDAEIARKILADNNFAPDFVLCSPTIRTRETLAEVQKSFPANFPIEYEPKIYNSSERELLKIIAKTPENVHNLLVVGHNPSIHQLTVALAKSGDERLIDNIYLQFPPCSMVVISMECSWKNIENSCGKLLFAHTPDMA